MNNVPRELQPGYSLLKDINRPRVEGALDGKLALACAQTKGGTHSSGSDDIQSPGYVRIQSSEQTEGIDTRGYDSPFSGYANLYHGVYARIYTSLEGPFDGRAVLPRYVATKTLLDDGEVLVDMYWGEVFDDIRVKGREA